MLAPALAHIDRTMSEPPRAWVLGRCGLFHNHFAPIGPWDRRGLHDGLCVDIQRIRHPGAYRRRTGQYVVQPCLSVGFASFNFPFAASLWVAGLALTFGVLSLMRVLSRPLEKSGHTDGLTLGISAVYSASSSSSRFGNSRLPSASPLVVATAAFNGSAFLSFPPQILSCVGSPTRSAIHDFRAGLSE